MRPASRYLFPTLFFALAISTASEEITPLLLSVADAPVPFHGSDGRTHLVYELEMTNFSSGEIVPEKVEILGDGVALQTLEAEAIAKRLQPAGERESTGSLAKSTKALLFLHIVLEPPLSLVSSRIA